MSAIPHASAQVTTQQTKTTDANYGDVTGAALASGSFVAGKDYLIRVVGVFGNNTGGGVSSVQVLHGSTAFAMSEVTRSFGANQVKPYAWFTVWTAQSGEGIKVQIKTGSGLHIAFADSFTVLAVQLTDYLTVDVDYFFNERATDDALSSTPVDGASVTLTPSGASKWGVISYAQHDPGDNTTQMISQLIRSGEASSTLNAQTEESAITNLVGFGITNAYDLTAVANTFKETSSASSGTAHARLHSQVFALNLSKFKNSASAFTAAEVNLGATTPFETNIQTISLTPDVLSDVWVEAFAAFDCQSSARTALFRLQVDDADSPAGQTTDAYVLPSRDNLDEQPMNMATVISMSAALHTVDFDASVSSVTTTPAAQDRALWAMTMELATGGGGPTVPDLSWSPHYVAVRGPSAYAISSGFTPPHKVQTS